MQTISWIYLEVDSDAPPCDPGSSSGRQHDICRTSWFSLRPFCQQRIRTGCVTRRGSRNTSDVSVWTYFSCARQEPGKRFWTKETGKHMFVIKLTSHQQRYTVHGNSRVKTDVLNRLSDYYESFQYISAVGCSFMALTFWAINMGSIKLYLWSLPELSLWLKTTVPAVILSQQRGRWLTHLSLAVKSAWNCFSAAKEHLKTFKKDQCVTIQVCIRERIIGHQTDATYKERALCI